MRLRFSKMHGIGNDFVVADATRSPLPGAEQVRRLADRREGVGCDQVLMAVPPTGAGPDLGVVIFNADGSRAEQCGNGMRCMAVFARERGLVASDEITFETPGGCVLARAGDGGSVSVRMGIPRLEPGEIPIESPCRAASYRLDIDGDEVRFAAVSMGNPHAVVRVSDAAAAPVSRLGAALQAHPFFPEGVNVGFAQILSRDRLRLRVFERGVGETRACGSGACAAVVAGRLSGDLDAGTRVELPGGSLEVRWGGEGEAVWMTGPTAWVFDAEIEL
jgi:diaminopimelate epimerase